MGVAGDDGLSYRVLEGRARSMDNFLPVVGSSSEMTVF